MLMEKICVRPRSPHELIHYYMMRRFGKDMTGMRHLSCREPDKSSLSSLSMGTLLRNSIDKDKEENAYLCESLVETGDHYYLVISEITLCGDLVDTCQEISVLKISPSETAMMLTRSEFVTVYNAADVGELSRKTLQRLKKGATVSAHDTGRLFMYFRPNNDHVNQQQYQLNEDVAGLCYFTENGQIICAAYSLRDILKMEKRMEAILSSPKTDGLGSLSSLFRKVPRYEFQEPVVYEYIQSGFEDFHTFVEAIKT